MSRMLGNEHVLVLRGAGHREVSGLPDVRREVARCE